MPTSCPSRLFATGVLIAGCLLFTAAAAFAGESAVAEAGSTDVAGPGPGDHCSGALPYIPVQLAELIDWLADETDYDCARLRDTTPVFQLCCAGDELQLSDHRFVVPDDMRGLYDAHTHTVYLMRPWADSDLFSQSVLLHELVHVLQVEQAILGCDNQGEWEAYKLQERWLLQHGIDPGFNWFYISLLSSCTVRDFHPASDVPDAADPSVFPPHCLERFTDKADALNLADFDWNLGTADMEALADRIYVSGKRLPSPAWFDTTRAQWQADLQVDGRRQSITLTAQFIREVTRTIETVLARGLATRVVFSDLGHAHLYFPQAHWQRRYALYEGPWYRRLEAMLADPELRPLYHAAEQLAVSAAAAEADSTLASRRACRNLFARHDGSGRVEILQAVGDPWNTVTDIPGFVRHSAGYLLSASQHGCFAYQDADGKTQRFDIGLTDLVSPGFIPDMCMP